jgi:predicted anti-sigma-YlaC factor YlaD
MHRVIRDHLEVVLAERVDGDAGSHLSECSECRTEVQAMREQARLLRQLKTEADPSPGFYARVMERIEAQGPLSIWSAVFDSPFGRRLAVASMALALILGLYLVTSEEMADRTTVAVIGEDQPGLVLTPSGPPDRDSVLVNLVTYREQ